MKILISLLIVSSCVFANSTKPKAQVPAKAVKTETKATGIPGKDQKKEEDCDDKAKKTVEIKPESISLTGNTGCTLE